MVVEVFRPGAKTRVVALPYRVGQSARVELASLPVFIGGWPSEDRNPVIGTTDAVSPKTDAALYAAFRTGWQLHPYAREYWSGEAP
jgi:hypothetical protein